VEDIMTDPQKLIHLYLENQLTPEQAQEFQTRIKEDDAFVRLFAQYGLLNSCIRNEFAENDVQASLSSYAAMKCEPSTLDDTGQMASSPILSSEEPDPRRIHEIESCAKTELEKFLAEQEKAAGINQDMRRPFITVDWKAALQALPQRLDRMLTMTRRMAIAASIVIAALVVVGLGINYVLSMQVVATLDDSSHAVWRIPRQEPQLRRGSMTLEQGYAQLTFKQGTQVLIQAPCTFELQSSNKMALENGSMTANVPSHAVGFTVKTPWTTVIDYGTEFGLSTGQTDGTEVHVFEGNVGVGDVTSSQVATEGQAAHVDQAGHIGLKSLDDRPNLFVRHMPKAGSRFSIPGKRLDLADVVGGGNGFGTGVLGRALDPTKDYTSFTFRGTILRRPLNNSGYRAGSGFIGIEKLPFIDGIFVPNGSDQSTTITSTGLLFQDCPNTHGTYYDGIVCGAVFDDQYVHAGRLAGHRYETPEQPSIGACANVGITFDLDSIRASMSNILISRFRAHCGISETLADIQEEKDYAQVKVTFWVLVDGRIDYSRELGTDPFESDQINIPLNPSDRFLTLITTTHQENLYCWSMFAEPALELERKHP
jgi:hypothetical protein